MGFNGEKTLYKNISKDKRALSPVIATVILISVTIVVAVSVAYWMGAIAGGYTSFEQIELPSTYAQAVVDATYDWKITIDLRNTGSAAATLDSIFLNAVPLKDYSSGWALDYSTNTGANVTTYSSLGISIPNGETVTLYLYISSTVEGCSAGTNVDLKMHTAAGKDYPTRVKLP